MKVYFVAVPPPNLLDYQDTGLGQSGQYSWYRTLGYTYSNGYFSRRWLGHLCKANKHMRVVAEKRPIAVAVAGVIRVPRGASMSYDI
ncbi:MAG: hypothetical protein IIA05_10240 [Proteobacteria bacterium]|nr:hypothetical protein [Pseudomonadota bacterium]